MHIKQKRKIEKKQFEITCCYIMIAKTINSIRFDRMKERKKKESIDFQIKACNGFKH